jgi:hypothetical protein
MTVPEPDEATTRFCANFTTADSCPTCLDLRVIVDDRQAERRCPTCQP